MSPVGGLAVFCATYLLVSASPGPSIAAVVTRVLSHGASGVAPYIAGIVVADLVWFTLAATGMALLAQAAHGTFVALRYAGAAYLLYLAYRSWTAPVQPIQSGRPSEPIMRGRLFLTSLVFTLANPKAMAFYLALMPVVLDLKKMSVSLYLQVAVAIVVIFATVLASYALAALRARRFFRSVQALRWLNRASGLMMGGAAVAVAAQ